MFIDYNECLVIFVRLTEIDVINTITDKPDTYLIIFLNFCEELKNA